MKSEKLLCGFLTNPYFDMILTEKKPTYKCLESKGGFGCWHVPRYPNGMSWDGKQQQLEASVHIDFIVNQGVCILFLAYRLRLNL